VPTSTSQSAFVPATRLTNYVVAHSEYSSPLARRSVLTGVLAEDDSDPDVATDDAQESQSPPSVSPPAQSQSQ
jgi:sigma-E factor negative regulatory protein RseA